MESATTTFALLQQATGGDEQAVSRLFERHRRRLAVVIHYNLSPRRNRMSSRGFAAWPWPCWPPERSWW